MDKVCPFSMGGNITECYREECSAFVGNECVLQKIGVSLYYISKNLRDAFDDYRRGHYGGRG